MNYLRDYYERALQEFGTTDESESLLFNTWAWSLLNYLSPLLLPFVKKYITKLPNYFNNLIR